MRRGRGRRSHRHDLLIMALAAILLVFAVVSALAWLALHLAVLAGVALLIGMAFHGGMLHERRRARPGQVQPAATMPATTAAVPTATVPVADYGQDEPGTRQQPSLQGDRDALLADPMSGARDLWGPS
jgi:hypothetical protein